MPRPMRRGARPVRRAVVTGAAYHAGKKRGTRQETAGGETPDVAAQQPQGEPALTQEQKLEQLKKLGELKSAGVLTEEEFQREKSKILEG